MNLEKHFSYIEALSMCFNAGERTLILTILTRDPQFLKFVKLICKNTINAEVQLSNSDKLKLHKHAESIMKIAMSRGNAKQLIINSNGGFLPILLPSVRLAIAKSREASGRKDVANDDMDDSEND